MKEPVALRIRRTTSLHYAAVMAVRHAFGPFPVSEEGEWITLLFFGGDDEIAEMALREEGGIEEIHHLSYKEVM